MPRRRAARPSQRPLRPSAERIVDKRDGQWFVRPITGATSVKAYTCPGCLTTITPATPHMVVWPVEKALLSADAIDERRHWHTSCWARRH
jgi:hypothetical protein